MTDQLHDAVANGEDFEKGATWRTLPALQTKLTGVVATSHSHPAILRTSAPSLYRDKAMSAAY
jgi:hypothetical protein